jgi:hypothetical protein
MLSSGAGNLVENDGNNKYDIFVYRLNRPAPDSAAASSPF